jgi:hypothetical protein
MKKGPFLRKVIFFSCFFVVMNSLIILPSDAAGSCQFGYRATDFDDEADPICEEIYWSFKKTDDGFDKITIASIDVDNSIIGGSDYGFSLVVRCTSKKLEVFAASDDYEMFYKSAYTSGGTVKVKFDSGSIKNYRFAKSTDNQAIFISVAKTFATALAKAKKSVSLKFSSSRGNVTLQFPVSDFAQHKKAFTTGGCKF